MQGEWLTECWRENETVGQDFPFPSPLPSWPLGRGPSETAADATWVRRDTRARTEGEGARDGIPKAEVCRHHERERQRAGAGTAKHTALLSTVRPCVSLALSAPLPHTHFVHYIHTQRHIAETQQNTQTQFITHEKRRSSPPFLFPMEEEEAGAVPLVSRSGGARLQTGMQIHTRSAREKTHTQRKTHALLCSKH